MNDLSTELTYDMELSLNKKDINSRVNLKYLTNKTQELYSKKAALSPHGSANAKSKMVDNPYKGYMAK